MLALPCYFISCFSILISFHILRVFCYLAIIIAVRRMVLDLLLSCYPSYLAFAFQFFFPCFTHLASLLLHSHHPHCTACGVRFGIVLLLYIFLLISGILFLLQTFLLIFFSFTSSESFATNSSPSPSSSPSSLYSARYQDLRLYIQLHKPTEKHIKNKESNYQIHYSKAKNKTINQNHQIYYSKTKNKTTH